MKAGPLSFVVPIVLFTTANLFSLEDEQKVAFRIEQGRMVVKGSIGDAAGLNLVIDSGATSTVVSRRVAKKLGLNTTKRKDTLVYGQVVGAKEGLLPELSMGSVSFRAVRVLVMDLRIGLSFRVDALIGTELLKRQPISIDYRSRSLTFGPVEHSPSSLRIHPRVPLPFLYVTVQEGERLRLMLDTGAEDLILFQRTVEEGVAVTYTPTTETHWGAGGRLVRVRRVLLSRVMMGNVTWQRLPASVLKTPENSYFGFDGIVGPPALDLATVNLDFQNGLISWTP